MRIAPFSTEQYYALYEFSAPHLLSVSDCETVTVGELLQLAQVSLERFAELRLGYTESQGQLALRQAIATGYDQVSPEEVVVLSAPVEGIYLTMRTLLDAQDEAIVLTPAYDALLNLAEHVGRRVHRWTLVPTPSGWALDLDQLHAMLTPKTKLLVVNFPHNPTGFLPTVEEFKRLLDIVRHHGLWLFCDEIYRGLELDSPALPSAADRYERSVVLSGLSKAYGLPGLRAGWLIVKDKTIRDALINWKHYTTICPSAPSEFLSLAALSVGEKLVARSKAVIRENLKFAEPFFHRWQALFDWRRPQAGSVALADVHVPSATAYCHQLVRDAGVLLLPGAFMGAEDRYVRFGFGRKGFSEALGHYEANLRQASPAARAP